MVFHGNHLVDGAWNNEPRRPLTLEMQRCDMCHDHKEEIRDIKCLHERICTDCIDNMSIDDLYKFSTNWEVARDILNELFPTEHPLLKLVNKHLHELEAE